MRRRRFLGIVAYVLALLAIPFRPRRKATVVEWETRDGQAFKRRFDGVAASAPTKRHSESIRKGSV